jgi:hypothetical protein
MSYFKNVKDNRSNLFQEKHSIPATGKFVAGVLFHTLAAWNKETWS